MVLAVETLLLSLLDLGHLLLLLLLTLQFPSLQQQLLLLGFDQLELLSLLLVRRHPRRPLALPLAPLLQLFLVGLRLAAYAVVVAAAGHRHCGLVPQTEWGAQLKGLIEHSFTGGCAGEDLKEGTRWVTLYTSLSLEPKMASR